MPAVPRFWRRNSAISTPQVRGTTNGLAAPVAISKPSTADSTEIAGVMTPSPYSSAAPMIAPQKTAERTRLGSFAREPAIRPSSAKMPPSPRLSARRMNPTYLTVTTMVSDQKIRDTTPNRLISFRAIACGPLKHSRTAYKGLGPMSPYTTPSAAIARRIVAFRLARAS